MYKHEMLLKLYRRERNKIKCELLNRELLDVADLIAEEYKIHAETNLRLEKTIHNLIKKMEEA